MGVARDVALDINHSYAISHDYYPLPMTGYVSEYLSTLIAEKSQEPVQEMRTFIAPQYMHISF